MKKKSSLGNKHILLSSSIPFFLFITTYSFFITYQYANGPVFMQLGKETTSHCTDSPKVHGFPWSLLIFSISMSFCLLQTNFSHISSSKCHCQKSISFMLSRPKAIWNFWTASWRHHLASLFLTYWWYVPVSLFETPLHISLLPWCSQLFHGGT